MKEDKELIKEIVDRLKTAEDYTYKEGSWEKFKAYDKSPSTVLVFMRKYASIAALLLVTLGFVYYNLRNKEVIQEHLELSESIVVSPVEKNEQNKVILGEMTIDAEANSNPNVQYAQYIESRTIDGHSANLSLEQYEFAKVEIPELYIANKLNTIVLPERVNKDEEKHRNVLRNHLIAANSVLAHNVMANNSFNSRVSPKFFQFANRFELGLFISPFTTTENLKIGAGLALSYNLTDKISVRTGASYNTYEVGMLKNPFDDNSVEEVFAKVDHSVLGSPGLGVNVQYTSRVSLPNINAVTGFVQSIEIPVEIKYNLNKSFYAVGGISYSTILNQERNAHYIDNIDNNLKMNFADNTLVKVEQKMVEKTVKSATENVNPSAYSGFVNLSIGKKVNVNKKFGVSIEPYYKIPVGGFRKADMNYSNAGVRVMTNF